MSHSAEFMATIHEEDGSYWAEVADMPGLFASGDTLDELVEALTEAYMLYVSDLDGVSVELIRERPAAAEIKLRVPTHA